MTVRLLVKGAQSDEVRRRLAVEAPQLEMVVGEVETAPDLVALSYQDYLDLVDDAEDREAARAYARTRGEEAVPIAIADRLLAGDNPIKVWREFRGLSAAELANKTGLSRSYLSELEAGKRAGPVATLRMIATALGVDLDDVT